MTQPDFLGRTGASYDALAVDYAERFRDELVGKPVDRAVLGAFAELVKGADVGPVADVGCGPGRIAAYLHGLGLPVFGIDLSPRMVAVARLAHPGLRFDEGSMTALAVQDGSVGGIVAWYSIIHVPQDRRPDVFAEFHRVLAPGGYVQLAFPVGDAVVHRTEIGGHRVSLDFHPQQPDHVAEQLSEAGLSVRARVFREPDEDGEFRESAPQGFLLARKPTRH